MLKTVALAFLASFFCEAAELQIVKPMISQMEDGAPDPPGFSHVPGEVLFFHCRIAGYAKDNDQKVRLSFSIEAFDPKGIPITELYKNEIAEELTLQDKEWMPRIRTQVAIPPLVGSGTYKIVVKVEDVVGKTSAELSVPFQVRARDVPLSETLVVRNFRFFRGEDDTQELPKAVYKPGDGVWARFDITGFKYGAKNKVEVSYVTSVIAPSGKVLWTQPEPAAEQSESFYPKPYVPAAMGISLQSNIRPGDYTIAVTVKDAVGGQTFEGKYTFTVE
jgi:hypothetical protein